MNVNYCLRTAKRFHGRAIAIQHEDQEITYAQFYENVENSARKLIALGASKGDRVAILNAKFARISGSLLLHRPRRRPDRASEHALARQRNHLHAQRFRAARYFSWMSDFAALVPQIRAGATTLEHIVYAGAGECPDGLVDWKTAGKTGVLPHDDPDENDLVGLFYTSGTTGGPKGAMLTHRNVYSNALHSLTPSVGFVIEGKWLHSAPMFHLADAGAIHALTLVRRHALLPSQLRSGSDAPRHRTLPHHQPGVGPNHAQHGSEPSRLRALRSFQPEAHHLWRVTHAAASAQASHGKAELRIRVKGMA